MADDSKISIEVSIDGDGELRFKALGDAADDFGKRTSAALDKAGGSFDVFKGVFEAETLLKGFDLLAEAAEKLFDIFIVDGVKSAIAAEDALNQLNFALAQSGEFTDENSDKFQKFAEQMQQTTKFSNDSVLAAGALVESLGNLSEEGLEKATAATADLAATMRIDLGSASQIVGKAAEGNVTAIKKLIPTLEEGETNAETFANAIDAINQKFGGSAAAQINTFSGVTAQLHNNFDDLIKVFGQAVIENNTLIEAFKEVNVIIQEFTTDADDNKDALKEFIGDGILLAIDATSAFIAVLQALEIAGKVAFAPFKVYGTEIAADFAAAGAAIQGNFSGALDIIVQKGKDQSKELSDVLTQDSGLDQVQALLARVKDAAESGFNAMKDGATTSVEPINQAKNAVDELTKAQIALGEQGQKVAERLQGEDPNQKYAADLAALEEANSQELDLVISFNDAVVKLAQERDKKLRDLETKKVTQAGQDLDHLRTIYGLADNQQIQDARAKLQKLANDESLSNAARLEATAKLVKDQNDIEQQRIQFASGILGNIATLTRTNNEELFEIGKQASAAQAVIDGYAAVQKALASAPPPFNFIAAAAVGVATAVNVANIEATHLATGIDSVPGIGTKDNFPAVLAPGERVVPTETNKDLKAFLDDQSGTKEILSDIRSLLSASQGAQVYLDGKLIFDSIRNQIRGGRVLTA